MEKKWLISKEACDANWIIIIRVCSKISWDDYHAFMNEAFLEAKNLNARVDIILDAQAYPLPGGNPLAHFQKSVKLWQSVSNLTSINVVMKLPTIAETFANIAMSVVLKGKKVRYPESLDAARALIKKDIS